MIRNVKGYGWAAALALSASLAACTTAPAPATVPGGSGSGAPQNTAPVITPSAQAKALPTFEAVKPTLTLDLRQTPLETLNAEQRRELAEAAAVRVTLSDGAVLDYQNVHGVMLLNGDMALSPSAQAYSYLQRADKNGLGEQSLSRFAPAQANWPGHVVPYYWRSGTFTAQQENALRSAIQHWNEQIGSVVRWEWNPGARQAVRFISGDASACGWSYVGSIGGHQDVSITCFNSGTIIHEMGHAAGLWHEHQRCDRDNYVRVPGGDLNSNMSRNCYDRHYSTYDFDSVMNYGAPYVYP